MADLVLADLYKLRHSRALILGFSVLTVLFLYRQYVFLSGDVSFCQAYVDKLHMQRSTGQELGRSDLLQYTIADQITTRSPWLAGLVSGLLYASGLPGLVFCSYLVIGNRVLDQNNGTQSLVLAMTFGRARYVLSKIAVGLIAAVFSTIWLVILCVGARLAYRPLIPAACLSGGGVPISVPGRTWAMLILLPLLVGAAYTAVSVFATSFSRVAVAGLSATLMIAVGDVVLATTVLGYRRFSLVGLLWQSGREADQSDLGVRVWPVTVSRGLFDWQAGLLVGVTVMVLVLGSIAVQRRADR